MGSTVDLSIIFPGASTTASLMRKHDWSTSVLGDPSGWSATLKSTVSLMLNSKFPMFLAWGQEMGYLYNDAYVEILGNKHPAALGARFPDVWAEIWTDIRPIVDRALAGEPSYFEDLPLIVERAGLPEKAWFTFSYSPVRDSQGVVAGMFCSVIETTRQVLHGKLRQFQLEITDRLQPLNLPEEIVATSVEMLGKHLGGSRCWYAEIDEDAGTFNTCSGWSIAGLPPLPSSGKVDAYSPALLATLRAGKEFVCNDLSTDPRMSGYADLFHALEIGSILIVPAFKRSRLVYTINVVKPGAYQWSAEDIQAAEDVVERTWLAMENATVQQNLDAERGQSEYLLSSMNEGFALIGKDWQVRKLNAAGYRILRLSQNGRPDAPLWDLLPGDLSAKARSTLQGAAASRTPTVFELDFTGNDGRVAWLEIRTYPALNEETALLFRDVTAQKNAEFALRDSEEHLNSLFSQTAAGIAESDPQGRLVGANARLCMMLGRTREEIIGTNISELTHPDDRDESAAAFKKLLEDGAPFEVEKRYLRPDGKVVWASTTVSLIRRSNKRNVDTVLAVILDITERKRTEESFRDETRILDILNQTGQALASTLDMDALLQSITDSGTQLTGAEFGAFFYNGKDEHGDALMLYNLSGAPREAFEKFGHPRATALFSPTFHGQPAIRSDDITKDPRYGKSAPHHGMPKGHLPVTSYLAVPVVSRSGEVLGGLFFGHSKAGMFTERTERIITGLAAQAAIAIDNARLYELAHKAAVERESLLTSERAARAEAERLIRSKDEFLAMLAHELRNPLAPVSAAADILRFAATDPARVRQVSDIISRQIRHFTHLIDDLMDVSRVTRGLIQLESETLDIKAVVGTAIEQVRPLIEARQHTLMTRMDATPAVVYGDRTRLVQIISNLLNNAAKYTPNGGEITLKVEVEGRHVRIIVTDNGNGIEPTLLPHVFDLFTQGTRSLDRSQGGLGIGLALVKAISTLHNGDVTVHSDGSGLGSTFTVSIPLAAEKETSSHTEHADPGPTTRHRILVVDDNLDAAHSLAILLKAFGHSVTVAGSATEALDKAEAETPEIFILDIGLPDMTGYELASRLRARPDGHDRMFIALTGYGQPQDRQQAFDAGFDHHFVKPVNIQLLMNILSANGSTNSYA